MTLLFWMLFRYALGESSAFCLKSREVDQCGRIQQDLVLCLTDKVAALGSGSNARTALLDQPQNLMDVGCAGKRGTSGVAVDIIHQRDKSLA